MRLASIAAPFICLILLATAPATASDGKIGTMIGNWEGAGKLTYTKTWTFNFKCKIEGRQGIVKTQVDLLGKCWAGPFGSRMGAALRYNRKSRTYTGKFRDGTDTFVIDIKGKPKRRALALDLKQGKQRGAMALSFKSDDQIDLKISVIHPKTKAKRKVIDLALKRRNQTVGALEK